MNFEYFDRQKEAIKLLSHESSTITVLYGGAASGGKSWLGCDWQLKRRLKYPNTRGMIARAVLKDLRLTTLKRFYRLMAEYGLQEGKHWTFNGQDNVFKFYNGSEIILMHLEHSPSDPEYQRLGSLELTDCFIDEAGEIQKRAYEIVSSRVRYELVGGKPKILMSCNPIKNWLYTDFFDAHRNGTIADHLAFVPALPTDNPHTEPAYLEMLDRMNEVDKRRLKYGDWDYDESHDRLYYYDDLLRCYRDELLAGTMYITADIAAMGNDKTVIGVWNGWSLVEIVKLEHHYPHEVAAKIREIAAARQVKLANVVVDADGLGIGVAGILKCRQFNNGAKAVDSDNYMNLKAECYYKLGELIGNNGLTILTGAYKDEIIRHMETVRRVRLDKEGKKAVTSKDEIKKRNGFSPDMADMIMMRMYFDLYPNYGRYAIR